MKIEIWTNEDEGFYELMGPYLSNRQVVKEMGNNPIWDDPGKLWFLATTNRDELKGFAALRFIGERIAFVSAYVRPEHRKQGLYRELVEARVEYVNDEHPDEEVTTVACVEAKPVLAKAGFKVTGTKGSFFNMQLARGQK